MKMNYAKLVVGLGVLALSTVVVLKLRTRTAANANENVPSKTVSPTVRNAVLDKPFEATIHKSVLLPEQLKVTFEQVTEDSRCPQGVDCAWSGLVTVTVQLEKDGRKLGSADLTVQGSRHTTEESIGQVGSYWIKLIEVAPEKGLVESPGTVERITLLLQNKPISVPDKSDKLEKGKKQSIAEPKLHAGEISLSGNIGDVSVANKSLEVAAFTFTSANGQTSIVEVAKKKVVTVTAQTSIVRRDIERRETPVEVSLADIKTGDVAVVIGVDSETGKPLEARLIEVLVKSQSPKRKPE